MTNEVQSSKSNLTLIWHLSFVIWIFAAASLFVAPVYAGNTALSKSSFIINGESGSVVTESLTVSNLSPLPQNYRFGLAGLDGKTASIVPRQFQLGPGAEQTVLVRFRPRAEISEAKIELLAYDSQQTGNFKVGQGIRIPVRFLEPTVAGAEIFPSAKSMPLSAKIWLALVYGIDLSLVFVVLWLYRRRQYSLWLKLKSARKINFL